MSWHVLRARPGAAFAVIAPAGFRILSALDQATMACGVDLLITCGSDSHDAADPHSMGEAFDISVRDLSVDQLLEVKSTIERTLGALFTVLYEVPASPVEARLRAVAFVNSAATAPHLHVQRKKGTFYPPPPTAAARSLNV